MRVGFGIDAHRFREGRDLVLGGVKIPFEKGLEGHSDADVLVHALMDALLGACAGGDIGILFPDNDPEFKGISSLVLLAKVAGMLGEKGHGIVNIDLTVVCEKPKIAEYRGNIIENIAGVLGIDRGSVSLKGTTTEKMGFTGRGEGIIATAAVLVDKLD